MRYVRIRVLVLLLLFLTPALPAFAGPEALPLAAISESVSPKPGGPPTAVPVLTNHNDNRRTGANLSETSLTTTNVNSNTFGKLFSRPVDGQIYAQPLYVPNLVIPGKGTHNVVFVATTRNSVYAFDADDPAASTPLWKVSWGNPVPSTDLQDDGGPYLNIVPDVGIIGTPVIDAATNTMFVVPATKEGGVYYHKLHALDILTGAEKTGSPVTITASVPGTGSGGDGSGNVIFLSKQELQRAALSFLNGFLYIPFAGYSDTYPYRGWILKYNPTSLAQVTAYTPTPNGNGSGIWHSGNGLSAAPKDDSVGGADSIYFVTGNGDYDLVTGGTNLAGVGRLDQNLALDLTPATRGWFTPYNELYINNTDLDLGSTGALPIPQSKYMVLGGKEGKLYVLDRTNLGGFNAGADSQIPQSFLATTGGYINGAPIYWKNSLNEQIIYIWGNRDYLKAYKFKGTGPDYLQTTPVSQSPFYLQPGMTGGILSVSSNGNTAGTGILWASHQLNGDANKAVRPGILRAFDANDVSKELWNSEQNAARDSSDLLAKFAPPTISNGKVYMATFSNQLAVYGLLYEPPRNPIVPPNVRNDFSQTPVLRNIPNAVKLTFSINNPNPNTPLTGISFVDNLPTQLKISNPSNLVNNCGGTLTASPGTSLISLTSLSLGTNQTCTFELSIDSTAPGYWSSVTEPITSSESGPGSNSNKATLQVLPVQYPTLKKHFLPANVAVNETSVLTFTLTNPNTTESLTGVRFNDYMPFDVKVVNTGATPIVNECGNGTIDAPDAQNSIRVSLLTLAPAQICKIKVTVKSISSDNKWLNQTDPISAIETGLGARSNEATLAVAPQFIPQFSSGPEPDSLIDMGSSPAGTPVSKPLNIQNVGKAPLKVEVTTKGSGIFGGINSGDFTLSGANFNPFITLAPNEAKALTITCNPSLVGTGTASLTFKTDDLSQPLATYNLRCTGTFPGVTKPTDDGTGTVAGTLSFALAYVSTGTINFNLTTGNTVTLTSGNLPPLKAGVKLLAGCGSTGPNITINGNGRPGGLVLGGNNQVSGLKIMGFNGPQLTANSRNNKLSCIKVSK